MVPELVFPQTFFHSRSSVPAAEDNWLVLTAMEKVQAEQLLDWLESRGFKQREISLTAEGRFKIRFFSRPGRAPHAS
jgi:hypothetical protein